jgi:nicotinamide-nucleotide amidase
MSDNNARQADVPDGATVIEQTRGTAPGLICPVGTKVVYAVPGVPYEMADMFTRAIRPDLVQRMQDRGERGVIVSRVLRTWGTSESALAEALDGRVVALDGKATAGGAPHSVTLAFLASGIEGIKVRVTARADTEEEARALLAEEEDATRSAIADAFGDIVFGTDDESMEHTVAGRLQAAGLTLGLAESLTGGLIASRLVGVEGASGWFKGGVVAYDSDIKYELLDVPQGPVVSERAARAMAEGARRVLDADVGLAVTGVAGPDEQEGQPVGTVFVGLAFDRDQAIGAAFRLPGDRERVRQFAAISALDMLRRRLGEHPVVRASV